MRGRRDAALYTLAFLLGSVVYTAAQSIQTITPPVYLGPKVIANTTPATATLNANGEYVAWILQAPKTGTIDRVHYYATTVTANGDGLRARIETVSTADGNPSGSLVGGSSEVTVAATTANSWNRSGAGLAAAVTKGDVIAVKLTSPAAGTTTNLIIRTGYTTAYGPGVSLNTVGLFPYQITALPTATKGNIDAPLLAIEYNDGTTPYVEMALPAATLTSTSFASNSTPDERGNLFQVPVPARVVGVYHQTAAVASTTYDLVLYNSAGAALGTISVDGDQMRTTGANPVAHFFSAAITLTANTDYRIVLKPTTTTNVSQVQMVLDTATGGTRLREAVVGGTTWKLTTRTDAGAWSNTDDTIASIGLIVDGFSDGACAASGVPCVIR